MHGYCSTCGYMQTYAPIDVGGFLGKMCKISSFFYHPLSDANAFIVHKLYNYFIFFIIISICLSSLTFPILSLFIFFPFLVSPPPLFSISVLYLSLYFSLLCFPLFSLYSQHVSHSSIFSHLTKFWLDQISGCWVLVMAFRWWVSILELNQWPTLVVGCFDVCWIRLVWDGNFCPTHGYLARPDPNGPDFTRSNKE